MDLTQYSNEQFKEFIKILDSNETKEWLLSHEQDIAFGINDFSELEYLFKVVIGRKPVE